MQPWCGVPAPRLRAPNGRASKLGCSHCSMSPWKRLCHHDAKGTGLAHLVAKEDPRRDSDLHQCLSGSAPDLFLTPQAHLLCAQPHDQIYSHQRSSSPCVCTEFERKTFAFRGAHRWNSLPSNLRNMSQPSPFMSAAKVCLLS